MHIPIFSILQLSFPELCVTQSDNITFTCNGRCACAVSRDLCTGGPPKPHVTIFWPRIIVYSLYNSYGATMTIKDSFILEHPHVKAVFGRKKNLSGQNRSPKWRFFGNLRVDISKSNIIIETFKRHFLARNDVFRRTLRKNPFRGVGCSLIEKPKKRRKNYHPKSTAKSRIWGTKTPKPVDTKFWRNQACQFLGRSVKGFWCGEGSNFGLFH